MDRQNYLSNLSEFEGMSLREISAHTGHHFNTVKKYVDREDWNEAYNPRKERESRLDPLKPILDEWIKEDLKRRRKDRRTATKMYKDLCADAEHSKLLAVSDITVRRYVSTRKKELNQATYSTAMYGLHSMGWVQVDFGDITVVLPGGSEEQWHILVVSFLKPVY